MLTDQDATGRGEGAVRTLDVRKDVRIAAPVEVSFEAVLAELGPEGVIPPEGEPFPMVIEPRPGGRWYRDLGDGAGHLWGHVQVIKPPTLLEICGPLFMSFPAISHVQYRLEAEGDGTRLILTHKAMGLLSDEVREGVGMGWEFSIKKIREIAERR